MNAWANAVGYQLVWFCAVIGAGRGLAWPGLAAGLLFAGAVLAASRWRGADARLAATALALGLLVDGSLARLGLLEYAAHGPWWPAPAWILGLWLAFAMTFGHSLRLLQERPLLAAALGAVGGPLAYLAAARGWSAVALTAPGWQVLATLAIAWGMAVWLLSRLARRWRDPLPRAALVGREPA